LKWGIVKKSVPCEELKVCFVYNTLEELFFSILYQVNEIVKSIGLHKGGNQKSVVGIATCYKPDGLGFEYQQRQEILQNHPDQLWGPASLLFNGYRGSFRRLKWLRV
jgi:hypothetical protein